MDMHVGGGDFASRFVQSMGQLGKTADVALKKFATMTKSQLSSQAKQPQSTKKGSSKQGATTLQNMWSQKNPLGSLHKVSLSLVFNKILSPFIKVDEHSYLFETAGPQAKSAFLLLEKGHSCSEIVARQGILELKEHLDSLELIVDAKTKSGQISPEQKAQMKKDIANLKEMAVSAREMEAENFLGGAEKINTLIVRCLKMREGENSLSSKFPTKLDMKDIKEGIMVDEDGKEFDHLRGPDGLTETGLKDFCNAEGGKYELIDNWLTGQQGDSWCLYSQAAKCRIMQLQNEEPSQYFWKVEYQNDYGGGANAALQGVYVQSGGENAYGSFEEFLNVFDNSIINLLAYNMEFLAHTKMDGVDQENRTINIFRTESHAGLAANGFDPNNLDTENEHTLKRSVFESGSVGRPIIAKGTKGAIGTQQKRSFHHCLFLYQLRPLLTDKEKEVGFITSGAKFKFKEWEGGEAPKAGGG